MIQKCNKCGYVWDSLVEDPKQCARCKRYDYKDIPKESEGGTS